MIPFSVSFFFFFLFFFLTREQEDIIGSAYATAAYLHEQGFNKKVYVIGEAGIGIIITSLSLLLLSFLLLLIFYCIIHYYHCSVGFIFSLSFLFSFPPSQSHFLYFIIIKGAELKEFGIPHCGIEEHRGTYSIEDIENIKIDPEVYFSLLFLLFFFIIFLLEC